MGAVLIALVVGALVLDQMLSPWYPFLFVLVLVLSLSACYEFLHLLPGRYRLPGWLCYGSVGALLVTNWLPALAARGIHPVDPWRWLALIFAGIVLVAFTVALAGFQPAFASSGEAVPAKESDPGIPVDYLARLGLFILLAAYLGLLPSFLVQLRFAQADESKAEPRRATAALALAIFVPKCCDIGAYFTGRFLGRHRMAPVLSPNKTWEGAGGGIAAAILASYGIEHGLGGVLPEGTVSPLGFGVAIGGLGIIGDLAESFLKRACQRKDASTILPGFGGVLDVVDSVIFAAPAAYLWLA
jgi:phosphatidate cytidylyltransferase